ncbi:hypothetical protein QUB12_30925 [Microcoleus sp. B7-D4]
MQSASPTTAIYATAKADITAAMLPIFSHLLDLIFNSIPMPELDY